MPDHAASYQVSIVCAFSVSTHNTLGLSLVRFPKTVGSVLTVRTHEAPWTAFQGKSEG